ncbi:MAG: energy transducer TonB [Cytophagia bacterium]|nr:energy transducer TonB [Cytophagia bacterium]
MKNKITIMNERHRLADEEVDGFKNFDALLSKHRSAQIDNLKIQGLKLIILIMMIGGIAASIFYLIKDSEEAITIHEQSNKVINSGEENSNEVLTDTITTIQKNQAENKQKTVQKQASDQKPEVKKLASIPSTTPVYTQAEPVEGYAHLYDYFNKELVYPVAAIKDSIQGVLTVSFTINKDGLPENLQLTNSLGQPFEEEARRLILNMPSWKPAMLNGQPVTSRLSLPFTFQIRPIKKIN